MLKQFTMIPFKASLTLFLLLSTLLGVSAPVSASAIDFRLSDLQGKPLQLSSLRGHWVVLNFWARWCAPCTKEIPELIRFQAQHPEIRVLGINVEQTDAKQLRPFVKRFPFNYPLLLIGELPLTPLEPLKGLPTTAIIDPDGKLVSKHTGPVTAAMLKAFFAQEGLIGE